MVVVRFACICAALGALAWLVGAVRGWGGPVSGELYAAGLVLGLLALAAAGYRLVDRAPVWLRAVVTVATAALGYVVWTTVRNAGTESAVVLGGGLALLTGAALGLLRARARTTPEAAAGGRHAR